MRKGVLGEQEHSHCNEAAIYCSDNCWPGFLVTSVYMKDPRFLTSEAHRVSGDVSCALCSQRSQEHNLRPQPTSGKPNIRRGNGLWTVSKQLSQPKDNTRTLSSKGRKVNIGTLNFSSSLSKLLVTLVASSGKCKHDRIYSLWRFDSWLTFESTWSVEVYGSMGATDYIYLEAFKNIL